MKSPAEELLVKELSKKTKTLSKLSEDLQNLRGVSSSEIAADNSVLSRESASLLTASDSLLGAGSVLLTSILSILGFSGAFLAIMTKKLRIHAEKHKTIRDAGVREYPLSSWDALLLFNWLGVLLSIVIIFVLRDKAQWDLFSRSHALVANIDWFKPSTLFAYSIVLGIVFFGIVASSALQSYDSFEFKAFSGFVFSLAVALAIVVAGSFAGQFFVDKQVAKYIFIGSASVLVLSSLFKALGYSKLKSEKLSAACRKAGNEIEEKIHSNQSSLQSREVELKTNLDALRTSIEELNAQRELECARWNSLSKVQQLEEIRLSTEIEAKQEERRQYQRMGDIADRKAKAEIAIAERQAEEEITNSRNQAEAEIENIELEKQNAILAAAKAPETSNTPSEKSRRICKYCGCDVDSGLSAKAQKFSNFSAGSFFGGGPLAQCTASPTGHHVLF